MNHPNWRPGASRQVLERRADLLGAIRDFFAAKNVMEVETPVLSKACNSDPNILSIATDSNPARYLRTSPEYPMKRLLASGSGDIFELGRVFRRGEQGRMHNPEFTMAEWYRIGMPYLDLATEVVELIRHCAFALQRPELKEWPVNRMSYQAVFEEHAGINPFLATEIELAAIAAERGIHSPPLQHGEWLDLIMAEIIQPALPGESFTIIFDYPPEQAALSRIRQGDPPVAERFEVFAGQQELANGYQELTDSKEQRQRFDAERRMQQIHGDHAAPVDENLLAALEFGMPECSGVAMGVDRLLMLCLNVDDISMVLSFPYNRA